MSRGVIQDNRVRLVSSKARRNASVGYDSFRAADRGLGIATTGSSDIMGSAAPSVWLLRHSLLERKVLSHVRAPLFNKSLD